MASLPWFRGASPEVNKALAFTFITNYANGLITELEKPQYNTPNGLNTVLKRELTTKDASNEIVYFKTLVSNRRIAQDTSNILSNAVQTTISVGGLIGQPISFLATVIHNVLVIISRESTDGMQFRAQTIVQGTPGGSYLSQAYMLPSEIDAISLAPLTATGKTDRGEQIEALCVERTGAGSAGVAGAAASGASLSLITTSGAYKQKCPAHLNNDIEKSKLRITQAMSHIMKIENVCKSQSGGYRRKSRKTKPRKTKSRKLKRTHRR